VNDWEGVLTLSALRAISANTKVAFEGDNEILWPHDPNGEFTVKSYYSGCIKGWINMIFQVEQFGHLKLPPNHAFLLDRHQREGLCFKGETFNWLVGVLWVLQTKRWLTTFLSIVGLVSDLGHLPLSLTWVSWVHSHTIKDVLVSWRRRLKKISILGAWKLISLEIKWSN